MNSRDFFMMQLFGGGGGGGGLLQSTNWLHVVFLVFLLAVPILKPERIRVPRSFRGAWICFALSIVAPAFISAVVTPMFMQGFSVSGPQDGVGIVLLLNAVGPMLFGFSLFLAMRAVVPGFIPPWEAESSANASSADGRSSDSDHRDV